MQPTNLYNLNLLKKYSNSLVFDYTEYPTKSHWDENFGTHDYETAIDDWFKNYRHDDPNCLFYVHTPFCEELCYFCLCSKEITKDYEKVKDYLYNYQLPEIEMLRNVFQKTGFPLFKEIYFGGGSPTYYKEGEFLALKEAVFSIVDKADLETWTVEIDPRRVDEARLLFYAEQGVNRISFGIQDFDGDVQAEINRFQEPELLDKLLTPRVRSAFREINFDLLIGLPKQTLMSIERTIQEVVALQPTQLQTMYVHYKPDVRKYMTRMVRNVPMPDFFERKMLFQTAETGLIDSGYVKAGFESYALPDDVLSKAMESKQAYYNSLGTQAGVANNFFAVGSSAHGSFGPYYFQNFYEKPLYFESVGKKEFPVYRGIKLTETDLARRKIIKDLRTYFEVDLKVHASKENGYKNEFREELRILEEFERDGLVSVTNSVLKMTELGIHFSPQICEVFDLYSNREKYNKNIPVVLAG